MAQPHIYERVGSLLFNISLFVHSTLFRGLRLSSSSLRFRPFLTMAVLHPESTLGQCIPPFTKYGITTYLPTWEAALRLRDGDPAIASKLQNIYPRLMPFGDTRVVGSLYCDFFLFS